MKRFYSEKEVQQLLLYFFFRIILGIRRCQTQGSRKTKKTKRAERLFNNNQTQARLLTKQRKVLQVPTPR